MTPPVQFSVISAVYNAEEYIDAFMDSLVAQSYPLHALEIILVDDGSTDDTLGRLQAWQAKFPRSIRVLTGVNGGPGRARNRGLDVARNPWVTFCDPDDVLDSAYFERIAGFIRRDVNNQAAAVTGRLIQYFEAEGRLSDTHALAWKFLSGERIVDLEAEPHYVHLSAGTVFLRRSVLEEFSLRFNEQVRPTFEDAHLVARYLGCTPRPTIGLVPEARYYYRQRAAGSSLAQSGWKSSARYTQVLDHGYLGLLHLFNDRQGSVPRWVQNTVLYDLMWYFLADRAMRHPVAGLTESRRSELLDRMQRVMAHIEPEAILGFALVPVSIEIRTALVLRFKGALPPVWQLVSSGRHNRYQYMYRGDAPTEEYLNEDGCRIEPLASKRIAVEFFGEVFAYQRVTYFLSGESPRCVLDGEEQPAVPRPGPPQARYLPKHQDPALALQPLGLERQMLRLTQRIPLPALRSAASRAVRRAFRPKAAGPLPPGLRAQAQTAAGAEQTDADAALRLRAAAPEVKKRYADAWLIMDRPEHAFDNAEHFYRYVKQNHPEINAWFVLAEDSPDWPRLRDEGFRLIPYGSEELVLLALNASYRISSDAALPSYFPIDRGRFGGGQGSFVFLQHGVIWNDLSRWLNDKRIDRFIASTRAEYAALTGDGSVYSTTANEVRLTGLARFDSLYTRAQNAGPRTARLITVMPTWRMNLADLVAAAASPEEQQKVVLESQFFVEWRSFLESSQLRDAAARNNLSVAFFVHPSLSELLPKNALPDYVQLHPQPGVSLHDLILESAAFITDYSSTAFDAAYIDCPVLYFQFDDSTFLYGDHPARPGYFDFQRDGFGPVAATAQELQQNLAELESKDFRMPDRYADRVEKTFTYRDASNCSRIFESILELEKG